MTVWFDRRVPWHAAPPGGRGAQSVYGNAAIQASLTIKVQFGLPLNQTAGFAASPLELAGPDWPVPGCATLCRRQETLAAQLPGRGLGGPPRLPVAAAGIEVRGEGERHARKYGGAKRRECRKVRLAIDEESMDVRAVEITDGRTGNAPMLPGLLPQVPGDELIAPVTVGGAYGVDRPATRTPLAA